MPPTLHPHLKRGLDFDDVQARSENAVEELPASYHGSQEWTAKRRRVEAIASRYLQGKPPVILSAGLRGPFDNGWKNPWASKSRITAKASAKDGGAIKDRSRPSRKTTTEGIGTTRARNRRSKEADATDTITRNASPEASRAAEYEVDLQAYQADDSLDDVEVPPATAPSPEEDVSDATEFYSANTEKCIQNRSPLTNPFWLRRPQSRTTLNTNQPTNHNTEISPTRSRSRDGYSQPSVGGRLHLALPKAPLRGQGFASREDVAEEFRSSASASMIISSPAKGTNTTPNKRDDLQKISGANAESCVEIPHSTGHQGTSSIRSQGRPSREDIQRSAQRLVDLMPPSSASKRQRRRSSRKGMRDKPTRRAPQHDLVASPALGASTGFVYRKIGNSKQSGSNVQTSKAREMSFSSSPAIHKDVTVSANRSPEKTSATSQPEPSSRNAHQDDIANANGGPMLRSSIEEAETDRNDEQEERQDLGSSRSNRDSAFPTRAAMLLARIEFQESTFSAVAPDSPRPWSQPQNGTPRPVLPAASPAITPLPGLSAQLDKSLPNKSVLRGPPMSTQELFDAASPFAFSTIKTKPEMPQRSSLRFALLLQTDDEQSRTNDTPAKSPTPSADRISLKAKNMTTTVWSFTTEKASQASQNSLVDRSRRSISDVELPQLDFHTSLDDYGLNGDVHFTDRFLRNLGDS